MDDMVFYPKGQLFFEEAIHDGNQFVTRYGKQPLDVLNMQAEQYVLVSRNEAVEMIREAARKPVEEITAEIFNDQLEVMPPIEGSEAQSYENVRQVHFLTNVSFFILMAKATIKAIHRSLPLS
ncbi:hypothetical protein POW08_22560 [Enterobacter kobei]|uniref:hypothetical protein n=1 Tax=Enterobacter kobei TaxID=208224 RepID=UPI002FFD2D99